MPKPFYKAKPPARKGKITRVTKLTGDATVHHFLHKRLERKPLGSTVIYIQDKRSGKQIAHTYQKTRNGYVLKCRAHLDKSGRQTKKEEF